MTPNEIDASKVNCASCGEPHRKDTLLAPHNICGNCRGIIDAVVSGSALKSSAYAMAAAQGLLAVPEVAASYNQVQKAPKVAGTNRPKPNSAKEQAKVELARRTLIRRRLLPYIEYNEPKYMAGWVHKDICQRLEKFSQDVAEGKSPRLMLFMPPRHGKSLIASVNFPAWHLGNNPDHEIIACSYASSLAMKFSRKVRAQLKNPQYKLAFKDCRLSKDSQAAEEWQTTAGGGYVAAGVGGGITGKGAHILIIDDPVKNREEAESETTQENNYDWYTSTAYTRLAPGGGVLVILTRWHDADLAGKLLTQGERGGDQWEVVLYPAIATEDEKYRKKGDPLHADRYNIEALQRIKRAIPPRDWEALYQQSPVSDEGDYFRRDDFQYYDVEELELYKCTIYQAWDLAIGQKEQNDYSVGITLAIDQDDNYYVVDVARGRWDGMALVERILDFYEKWEPSVVGIEKGHINMALGPFIQKRVSERRLHKFYINELATGRRDKVLRARAIQGRLQQGKLFFPRDKAFLDPLVNEMLRFPNGVHDDQIDALAWLGLMMQDYNVIRDGRPKREKGWRDRLRSQLRPTKSRSAMSA